jgi:ABC-type multidrug transport system fused ATPase/permease subunit
MCLRSHVSVYYLSKKSSYILVALGIFSSTVKKNILFGKEYDRKLFQRVMHATALDSVREKRMIN